jgi:hypothetical protein
MLARRLALAIALVAAFVGSQGPEFAQQYRQRLGGALDEVRQIVIQFDAEAASQDLTPAEGVRHLEASSDPLVQKRGEDMERTLARADRLEAQLKAMQSADPVVRLYVLVTNFDADVAGAALDAYEPAAPLSPETLTTAGVAGVLAWMATHLVAWPFRRRSRPASSATAA